MSEPETVEAMIEKALRELPRHLDYEQPITRAKEILTRLVAEVTDWEYGRGVSAGKKEALQYTAEERERYGKWVAQVEDYTSLRSQLEEAKKDINGLNQMIRDSYGYGQGPIDAYVAQCEDIDRLNEQLESCRAALRKIADREWSDETVSWRREAIEMQDEARAALAEEKKEVRQTYDGGGYEQ